MTKTFRSVCWMVGAVLLLGTGVLGDDGAAGSGASGLSGVLETPARVFRDQEVSGSIEVTVGPEAAQPGAIYLRYKSRQPFVSLIDSRFDGAAGAKEYAFALPALKFDGYSGTFELFHRDPNGVDTVLASRGIEVFSEPAPQPGDNVLANGSFELSGSFCGTRLGYADSYMSNAGWEGHRIWTWADLDGWWIDEGTREAVQPVDGGHSGGKALKLDGGAGRVSVVSSLGRYISAGTWTLSGYVKTTGAKASLVLDFVGGVREAKEGRTQVRSSVDLPAEAGEWTRVSLTQECPSMLQPFVHIAVEEGTVLIDDLQLEIGGEPTAFNVRPQEFLRIAFDGVEAGRLPMWLTTGSSERTITVYNDSREPLGGVVTLHFGPWSIPDLQAIGEFDLSELPPGQSRQLAFSTDSLRPDGYVLFARLADGGDVIVDGRWDFDPYAFTAYGITNMLRSRSVGRFSLTPQLDPMKIFGIGNTTIRKNGARFDCSYIEHHVFYRNLGMVCGRMCASDDETFMHAAAGGMGMYNQHHYQGIAPGHDFVNPLAPEFVDIHDPRGVEWVKENGGKFGREQGSNPLVVGVQLANEMYWSFNGCPCPTAAADEHFRNWCKQRHGDLATLNDRWGTDYGDWSQVDQVISAKFYQKLLAEKDNQVPGGWGMLHWGASWPKEAVAELDRLPGKTMDWMRWRTETGVEGYKTFRDAAKEVDPRTLYGTDLPIANFYKYFFMPFVRAMDAAMINVRYTSGYQNSFGVPHECMASIEMAESVADEQSKPFWGIEVYHQPYWPAESAGLQNWGLVAHGMDLTLIFSWYPFSDRGTPNDILEWEKRRFKETDDPFERACWYMIDADGAHLPAYESYARTLREIRRYHESFDGRSIKRFPTDVAYYASNDTGEYATLTTRSAPWGALSERASYTVCYLLRMAGVAADFVDDATLPEQPGEYKTLVVPLSPVLSQEAAGRIAGFAKAGGTVVLAGVSGQRDPWLRKYENLGGPAWAELAWTAPEYREEFGRYVFDEGIALPEEPGRSATDTAGTPEEKRDETLNEAKLFRGVDFGVVAQAEPIRDAAGQVIGWQRPWGQGRLIVYGICPDTWTTDPHVTGNLAAWSKQMIELAEIPFAGRWTTLEAADADGHELGAGLPAVDLVVRVKSDREKFVFALNQGGGGEGLIEVPVGEGVWRAQDVVDPRRPVEGGVENGIWQTRTAVGPLGYRVMRLVKE